MNAWDIVRSALGDSPFPEIAVGDLMLGESGQAELLIQLVDRPAKARGEVVIATVSDPDKVVLGGRGVTDLDGEVGRYRIEITGGASEHRLEVTSLADSDAVNDFVLVQFESPPLSSINPSLDDLQLSTAWVDIIDLVESHKPSLIVGSNANDSEAHVFGGASSLHGGDVDDEIRGLGGDDDLLGFGGNDWLLGGDGDDWLHGGEGNDLLAGDDGMDVLLGGEGDDDLSGGDGADALIGAQGRDRLRGGGGDDLVIGATGDDTLDGGDGNDLLDGDGSAQPGQRGWVASVTMGAVPMQTRGLGYQVVVPRALATNEFLTSEGATEESPRSWLDGADVLRGGAGADLLAGGGGDDHLDGGEDNDSLFAGWGDDWLEGGAGDDWLSGHRGNDRLVAGAGNDTLFGGGEDDHLKGGKGHDLLLGDDPEGGEASAGDDVLEGGDGNDELFGGAGSDVLVGGADNDLLHGGDGDDHLRGEDGLDELAGGAGRDHLDGGDGDDVMEGNDGDDQIIGGWGNDFGSGGEGRDTLLGGPGRDLLRGDEGDDWLDGSSDDDQLEGGAGADRLYGGQGNDQLFGFAAAAGGNDGDDELNGGLGNDHLEGGPGNDSLHGGMGTDTLLGGDGDDRLDGGADSDRIFGGAGDDRHEGGSGDDELVGESGIDELRGGSGNDRLYGGAGDDRILGDEGSDLLVGGEGDDRYIFHVGDGADRLWDALGSNALSFVDLPTPDLRVEWLSGGVRIYYGQTPGDQLDLDRLSFQTLSQISYGPKERTPRLELQAPEVNGSQLSGSGVGDRISAAVVGSELFGLGGDDILLGGEGDDQLHGGAGDDLLDGGAGTDSLYGGAGDDIFRFGVGSGTDRLYLERGATPGDLELGKDTVQLLALAPEDVQVERWGTDLRINLLASTDTFLVSGYFQNLLHPLSKLSFDTKANLSWAREDLWYQVLHGGAGNDHLEGHESDDNLVGGAGDDLLYGGAGDDRLDGGAGNDLLAGGPGDDVYLLYRGSGLDTVSNVSGHGPESGNDTVEVGNALLPENLLLAESRSHTRRALHVTIRRSGDSLLIWDYRVPSSTGELPVESMHFANGNRQNLVDVAAQLVERRAVVGSVVADELDFHYQERLILGLGGNDTLWARNGAVVLHGGGGGDHLVGGDQADLLIGGAGDDVLRGGAGDDRYLLFAQEFGIDRFEAQEYWLINDPGSDTVRISGLRADEAHLEALAADPDGRDWGLALRWGVDQARGLDLTTTTVEWVQFDDERVATASLLSTLERAPVIEDGIYRYPNGYLFGSDQDDVIVGSFASDALVGFGGDDLLRGLDAQDQLGGGPGDDRLEGGEGDDALSGGAGRDTLLGGAGDDLYLFDARDGSVDAVLPELSLGFGEDRGHDTLRFEGVPVPELTLELRVTEKGADADERPADFQALSGPIPIVPYLGFRRGEGAGVDVYATGIESVDVAGRIRSLDSLLSAVRHSPFADGVPEALRNPEGGVDWRAGLHGAMLAGSALGDRLEGSAGADLLFGFEGDDLLIDGGGKDYLDGGLGNDHYHISGDSEHFRLRDAGGEADHIELSGVLPDQIEWRVSDDDLVLSVDGVERGRLLDWGLGTEMRIESLGFADGSILSMAELAIDTKPLASETTSENAATLVLEAGRSSRVNLRTIPGLLMDAVLLPSAPAWASLAGNHLNTLAPSTDSSPILLALTNADGTSAALSLEVIARRDFVSGSGDNDHLQGSMSHDAMVGRDGNDEITGASGHDLLAGGAGADRLRGGVGHDALFGGAGVDALFGGAGDDRIRGGPGADTLRGGGGRDYLAGGAGADQLIGGPGDDLLDGGAGDDLLNGGSGADRYFFGIGDGHDRLLAAPEADAAVDSVQLRSGTRPEDVIFRQRGDDLLVAVAGTQDRLTVEGWFNDDAPPLAGFQAADDAYLLARDVAVLVEAMVSFDALRGGRPGAEGWLAESERLALAQSAWIAPPLDLYAGDVGVG
jgi:Ca2+-binding RTX toxin-like protein